MRSRLQFHRIGYQPGSYVSDPFEAHSASPFDDRVFDTLNIARGRENRVPETRESRTADER
jgi:hypothetical protein